MAVTSPASANAPASRPRQNLAWSRTHFVIRLLGLTVHWPDASAWSSPPSKAS